MATPSQELSMPPESHSAPERPSRSRRLEVRGSDEPEERRRRSKKRRPRPTRSSVPWIPLVIGGVLCVVVVIVAILTIDRKEKDRDPAANKNTPQAPKDPTKRTRNWN